MNKLYRLLIISSGKDVEIIDGEYESSEIQALIEDGETLRVIKKGYSEFNTKHFLELCEAYFVGDFDA